MDNSIFSVDLKKLNKDELEDHNKNYLKTKVKMKSFLDMVSKMKVVRTKSFREL